MLGVKITKKKPSKPKASQGKSKTKQKSLSPIPKQIVPEKKKQAFRERNDIFSPKTIDYTEIYENLIQNRREKTKVERDISLVNLSSEKRDKSHRKYENEDQGNKTRKKSKSPIEQKSKSSNKDTVKNKKKKDLSNLKISTRTRDRSYSDVSDVDTSNYSNTRREKPKDKDDKKLNVTYRNSYHNDHNENHSHLQENQSHSIRNERYSPLKQTYVEDRRNQSINNEKDSRETNEYTRKLKDKSNNSYHEQPRTHNNYTDVSATNYQFNNNEFSSTLKSSKQIINVEEFEKLREKIERIESEAKQGVSKNFKYNLKNFLEYCKNIAGKAAKKIQFIHKMLSVESKEAALTDLLETVENFQECIHDPGIIDKIVGLKGLIQFDADGTNNDAFQRSGRKGSFGLDAEQNEATSEIIAKFKNQIKSYEKQNEALRSKIEQLQTSIPTRVSDNCSSRSEIRDLKNENTNLKTTIDRLERNLNYHTKLAKDYEEKLDKLEEENVSVKIQNKNLVRQLSEFDCNSLKVSEVEYQLKTKDAIINNLENLIKTMRDGRDTNDTISQQAMIRNKINVLYSESFRNSAKFHELKKNAIDPSIDNLDSVIIEMEEKKTTRKKLNNNFFDMNNENDEYVKSTVKNDSSKQLNNEISYLDQEISSLQNKLKFMTEIKK